MSEICFLRFKDIQVIQFIDQQKVGKQWLPVEINFSMQGSNFLFLCK